jgi:hypothetical protein
MAGLSQLHVVYRKTRLLASIRRENQQTGLQQNNCRYDRQKGCPRRSHAPIRTTSPSALGRFLRPFARQTCSRAFPGRGEGSFFRAGRSLLSRHSLQTSLAADLAALPTKLAHDFRQQRLLQLVHASILSGLRTPINPIGIAVFELVSKAALD